MFIIFVVKLFFDQLFFIPPLNHMLVLQILHQHISFPMEMYSSPTNPKDIYRNQLRDLEIEPRACGNQ